MSCSLSQPGWTTDLSRRAARRPVARGTFQEVHDQYRQSLDNTNDALVARLTDLKPHLEAAIDAVEKEAGIQTVPASQRMFVGGGDNAELHVIGTPTEITRTGGGA